MTEFETDYLAHHGIKGQKWGVRNYQNQDGTLTDKGRKRYGIGNPRPKKTELKRALSSAVKSIQKRKEEKKAAEEQERKQRIIEKASKSPKALQKYAKELNKEDVDQIMNQIAFDQKIKDLRDADVRRGLRKVQDLSQNIGNFAMLLNNSKNLYNNTADIYNTLIDAGIVQGKNKLIKIGEQRKQDRSEFEELVRSGSAEDILKSFNKLTSSEQAEWLKRERNRADIKKFINNDKEESSEKAETAKKESANVGNQFLQELIQQGRYDDAERYFPDEMEEFYKILNK